jgi:hypothetical protein
VVGLAAIESTGKIFTCDPSRPLAQRAEDRYRVAIYRDHDVLPRCNTA